MPAYVGISVAVQSPAAGAAGQFNLEVQPGSISGLVETLKPGESLDIPVSGEPAILMIQSDFSCVVETTCESVVDTETIETTNRTDVKGQRHTALPLLYTSVGFGGPASLAGLKKVTVHNEGEKLVTVRSVYAAKIQ
jgi:hypothetical protein